MSIVQDTSELLVRISELELELKKARQSLAEKDKLHEALIDASAVGYWDWQVKENLEYLSPSLKAMLGYTDDELQNTPKTWQSLVHPDDLPIIASTIKNYIENNRTEPFEATVRFKHKQGHWYDVLYRGKVLEWDKHGNPLRVVGVNIDTSEIRKIEQYLQAQEERYGLTVESMEAGTWDWDMENNTLYWSPKMSELVGMPAIKPGETISFDTFVPFVHPDDVNFVRKAFFSHLESQAPFLIDLRLKLVSGEYNWFHVASKTIWGNNGKALRMVGGIINISERKDLEQRLMKDEFLLRETARIARVGGWEMDLNNNTPWWSKEVYEIFDLPKDTALNFEKSISFFPAEARPKIESFFYKAVSENQPFSHEVSAETALGRHVWILMQGEPVTDELGKVAKLRGIFQDITEKKQDEEKLSEQKQLFSNMFRYAPIGMALMGPDTRIFLANDTLGHILGYSQKELMNIKWPEITHPEDIYADKSMADKLFRGEINHYDIEKRFIHKSGKIVWAMLIVSLVRNKDGKPLYGVGHVLDITQRKILEQERLDTMDMLTRQNRQLTNFAHIVSHNLRSHSTNLNMMLGFMDDMEDGEDKKAVWEKVKTIGENLANTVDHLAEIVKVGQDVAKQRELIRFKDIFDRTAIVLDGNIQNAGATVKCDFANCPEIEYPTAYIESIMLNLMSNGIKYRSADRPPIITFNTYMEDGKKILTCADNGVGIDLEKYGSKIFGLYKTFHQNPDAHGVGLFLVKNQVEALGGSISVESKINEGTVFKIVF